MAQLKDTIVSGNLRVTDTTLTDTLHVTIIKAPTSSSGSTYGPGESGQVLKSNGTSVYWTSDSTVSPATAAPQNVSTTAVIGTSTLYARQDHVHAIALATGDKNGQVKIANSNVSVKGLASAAYVTEESLLRARSSVSTDGGATGWSQIGINQYNNAYPDGVTNKIYSWGAVVSIPAPNARFDLYYNHNSSTAGATTNGLQYRTGWDNDKKAWRMLLDSGNYTSYTVKKDGTGATGSWGISITGNATSATKATQDGDGNTISSTYLKLSGGTMTGTIQGTYSNTHIALAGGGIGDYATLDHKNNINISSWNGVSISNGCSTAGTLDQVTFSVDARTGTTQQRGNAIVTSAISNTTPCFFAERSDTSTSAWFGIGSGGVNHGIYSGSINSWVFVANATEAQTYNIAKNPSTATTYAISFGGETFTTGLKSHYVNDGLRYRTREGVANTEGLSILVLGNGLASSVAKNKTGYVRQYSTNEYYTDLKPNTLTASRTILLPDAAGTIAVFPAARTSGQVVITDGTAGAVKSSGYTIAKSVPSDAKFTDVNVLQSDTSSTSDFRPILLGTTHTTTVSDLSATITGQAYVSSNIFVKPNTGIICAKEFSTVSYINGTGAHLEQYGLYLKSYKAAALPAGGNYSCKGYVVRTYDGKSANNGGMLLTIDGGGLTIVGSGSASSLADLISDDQQDSNTSRTRLDIGGTLNTDYHGASEYLILSCNKSIVFLTNCKTIADRKPVVLDTALRFYPGTTETGSIGISSYQWNTIYGKTIYENGTSLASKYAAIGHTHGLLHSDLNQASTNGTTGGWSVIGIDPTVAGYVLKSIRINQTSPNWLSGDFGAGIAFGGSDTKGVISMRYQYPVITFAGGNHNSSKTEPTWYLKISGTSGSTYNLANFYDSTISRTANTVLAAPNGSNGGATFRKLVAADIPALSYLPTAGGTMEGNISFKSISGNTYPIASNKIIWNGGTDGIDIYYNLRSDDAGELIMNMRDDTNVRISFAYKGTVKSYIDTNGNFSGNAATSSSWATARTLTLGGQLTGSVSVKGDANMTLNGYLDRAFIYDDNAVPEGHTWAEYAWHKFAEVTITDVFEDRVITFLVSRTHGSSAEYTGILSAKLRTKENKVYDSAQLKWLVRNYGLSKDDFVMVYTSTSGTSTKAELWCRLPDQYHGLVFTVLKEHRRNLSASSDWTLVDIPKGSSTHGSSSYPTTGITDKIISSDGIITNSTTGTATSANALNLTHDNELNFSKLADTGHVWFGYRWNTQGTETSGGTTITKYKFGNATGNPNGLAGLEATTSTFKSGNFGDQLIVERTGGANMAGIAFKNTSGVLGYIAANTVDGDLYHYGATDTSTMKYVILDSHNYTSYPLPRNIKHIHKANGTDGSGGWVNIARITVTEAYADQPMTFTIAQRGTMQYRIHLLFTNNGTAAATEISQFIITRDNSWTDTNNDPRAYIIKPSDGIFDLYIRKTVTWDCIFVVDFTKADENGGANYSVTWKNVHAADSAITGGTEAVKKLYLPTTTNYAGSSSVGGAATSANKLNTNAGAGDRPVYFSGGVPVQCAAPASGSWFKGVPLIATDGVMEIGKYIDFHKSNDSTADYDLRLQYTGTATGKTVTIPGASGYVALLAKSGTSFYGMLDGDGKTSGWIRATSNGFIPSAEARFFQTATSSLGTSTWYFDHSYIQNMSANRLVLGVAKMTDGAAKGQVKFFSGNANDTTGTVTLECVNDSTRTGDYTVKLPTWNGTIPVFEKLFEGASTNVSLSFSDINEYDLFLITVTNSNATSEQVTVASLWISNVVGVHDMPLIWGGTPSSSGGACNVTSGWIQLTKNSGTTTFSVAHKTNVAQMTSSGWTISSPTYNLYIRKIFGLKAYKRT